MKTKRYYIKAMGSACYNAVEVIPSNFDDRIMIGLWDILRAFDAILLSWEPQFGWDNQPDVLCFNADKDTMEYIDKRLDTFLIWLGLLITEYWEND